MPKELYADLRGCYPTRLITSLLNLLTRNSSTSQGWIHYYMKKIKWQTIIFAWLNPVFWHKIWKILFTYLFISTSKASEKRPGDDVDLFIWELNYKQLYDDDHNDDLKKTNRFNDQNNSSARASRFLVLTHFLDFQCTTTTLNLLISRFM